jgi:hypothetical protein
MHRLLPCSACSRHVRADEATCRFCGAPIDARFLPPDTTRRLGRAAVFAFGATVAVAACSSEVVIDADDAGAGPGAGPGTSSSSSSSASTAGGTSEGGAGGEGGVTIGPMYGAAAFGGAGGQGGEGGEGGTFHGLYGAPPP